MEKPQGRVAELESGLAKPRPSHHQLLPNDLQRSRDNELSYASNAIKANALERDAREAGETERMTAKPPAHLRHHHGRDH